MSRFDRYLLSQLMALFGFFSLVLVSVYWINQAVALFEQLIADGESALVFVELSALTLPNVIRLVLPVAGFAAALYVTNRLSQESELVVMQATGFSPWRLARPALAFGLIVALLLGILSNFLVPAARGELADRRAEIAANVSARLLSDGNFQHPAPGLTLYIRQVAANGELEDLFLTDARSPDQRTTYTAERAFLVRDEGQPKLVMFDGMAQTLEIATQRLSVTRFEDFTYDIGALITQKPRTSRDLRELSTPRLLKAGADDLKLTGATEAEFTTEAHARIAQPLSAAVVALIGFAALLTGSFSRFGAWKQMATALGLMIFVQLLANVGTQLADQADSAWPAVYLPVLGGGISAVILLWLAGRPRRIGRARPGTEAAE